MTAARCRGALLWALAAALAAAIGWTLLAACGISWQGAVPHLDFCPVPPRRPAADSTAAERGAQLRQQIVQLELAYLRRPACPPPAPIQAEPAPPPPEPPKPAPPPPPPKPQPPPPSEPPKPPPAPPDDRLRVPDKLRQDQLGFMQGCWDTDPFRHQPSQRTPGLSSYCFSADGSGRLVFRRGGYTCEAPAHIEVVSPRRFLIRDADTICSDSSPWYQDRLSCAPDAQGVAVCSGEANSPEGRHEWDVEFHKR